MSKSVQEILNQGMGLLFHWYPEDFSISNLAETLAALANTQGGIVLIGIAPRSNMVIGVKNPPAAIDNVFQAALLVDPPLVLPFPKIEMERGRGILKIIVPSGLPNVYNFEGKYLKRKERRNETLAPAELRALLMERGVLNFESQVPPGATMGDLDLSRVKTYKERLMSSSDESYEEFLLQRACLKREGGIYQPTYAALLLFGKKPQRWLSNSRILAASFPGETYSDEFIKQEIQGTLSQQIQQAENFVRGQLKSIVRLVGLTRQEMEEYPLEAVREILVNAVAHRDYNIGGDSIQIHMFENRMEIHSPGRLPGPVNLDNLLEARFSRNAVIAQVLSDLGFVERLGYGLNRVVQTMNDYNLPPPEFKEVGGTFRVILWKTQSRPRNGQVEGDISRFDSLKLNDRQQKAVRYLLQQGRITNRAYQNLCSEISSETIRRDLVDLVKKGVIIKIGDKKSTYYILK